MSATTYKRALTLSAVRMIDFAAFSDPSSFVARMLCYAAASAVGAREKMMRKVRDYDAELKALGDKARTLKARKIQQLGELVASTGADALDPEVLAGALLHIVAQAQVEGNREAWRSDGAVFFQGGRKAGKGDAGNGQGADKTGSGGSQG